MNKPILLIMALILLGLTGNAQRNIDMKLVDQVLHPQSTRSLRDDIAPQRVLYNTKSDVTLSFRDNYSYDENEYFLSEVTTQIMNQGQWQPYSVTTYDYDYNLMPVEILTKKWDNEYVNDLITRITYNGDDFNPLVQEELYQKWANGSWSNIEKHMFTYEPEQTLLIKDWNGNNFENQYLYTFENQGLTSTVLLQYWNGGAWMNQEKAEIVYNHNHEILEKTIFHWDNPNWNNYEKQVYTYDGSYKLSKITKTLWENGDWSSDKVKTILYTHVGYNSTHAVCEANYGDTETLNDDIEMFYNEGQSVTYYHVNEINIDYVDVTKLSEHFASQRFLVAPNPIHDLIRINGEAFMKAEVYTLTGQKVLESNLPVITLGNLSSGAYLLKIYDQAGTVETQKMLVK